MWFGARRWQVELFTAGEAARGRDRRDRARLASSAARSQRRSPRPPARRPAPSSSTRCSRRGGLLAGVGVAAAAGLLLYLTVRAPGVQLGRLAITPLDMAALAAIAIVARRLGARLGRAPSSSTGGGGTSAFLLLVPGLIVFAATVVAARLLAPTPARARPRRPSRPGHAAARRGVARAEPRPRRDRRDVPRREPRPRALRRRLPLDARARPARRGELRGPRALRPHEDLAQLVPVLHGAQHLTTGRRRSTASRATSPSSATFSFLALPARTLPTVGGWRSDFSSRSRAQLARALAPAPAALRTLALPPGRQFSLPVTGSGDNVGIRAFFRSALGDYIAVALGHTVAGEAGRPARTDPVRARDARAAPLRHPEQRAHHRERRRRDPAERQGLGHARHTARRRAADREGVLVVARPQRRRAAPRRSSATSSRPTRTTSSGRVSRPTAQRCPCS